MTHLRTNTNWQPIETAPKDGTWILAIVCRVHASGKPFVPSVCQWTRGSWDIEHYTETGEEWYPTHWMPLPEPPTKGDALSGNGFMAEEAAKNVAATVAQVSGWKITEELQKWN